MSSQEVNIKLFKKACQETQIELVAPHVLVNLLNDSLRFNRVKFLPSLEELDDAIAFTRVSHEESFHILVCSVLDAMLPRFVS